VHADQRTTSGSNNITKTGRVARSPKWE